MKIIMGLFYAFGFDDRTHINGALRCIFYSGKGYKSTAVILGGFIPFLKPPFRWVFSRCPVLLFITIPVCDDDRNRIAVGLPIS